jgi:hypothetical protein
VSEGKGEAFKTEKFLGMLYIIFLDMKEIVLRDLIDSESYTTINIFISAVNLRHVLP